MFYGPQMRRARKRGWSGANREMYHHQNSAPLLEEKPEKQVEKNENESWMIKSSRRSDDAPVELVANPGNSSSHQKVKMSIYSRGKYNKRNMTRLYVIGLRFF